jgi:hypothetical protein
VGVTVSVELPGAMVTEEEEVEACWTASTAGGDDAHVGGDDAPSSNSLDATPSNMMTIRGGGYYDVFGCGHYDVHSDHK